MILGAQGTALPVWGPVSEGSDSRTPWLLRARVQHFTTTVPQRHLPEDDLGKGLEVERVSLSPIR